MRRKGQPKTVRFPADLDAWLTAAGNHHPEGVAGVVREACEAYRRAQEQDTIQALLLEAT